jgi:hypothetical protein
MDGQRFKRAYRILNDGTAALLHAQGLLARASSNVGLSISRLSPPTGNLICTKSSSTRA